MRKNMETARIFDIYRGTTHDGPGLRSTVFFQSCPLSCQWCHNPESIGMNDRIWWDSRSCIGCMLCHQACPTGANQPSEEGIRIDQELCSRCGACARTCPTGAMSFIAREWTMEALLDELLRDRPYYEKTGGGVTASGGECLNQKTFVASLFQELHRQGISTALDTSGFAPWNAFADVLPHTDYILYDLKLWDSSLHQNYTGQDNALIVENLRHISRNIRDKSCLAGLWIRTPLIPGATADAKNLHALGQFISGELSGTVSRWELCAFNNSCITKYQKLGEEWNYADTPLLRADEAEALRQAAVDGGVPDELVVVTGLLSES